MTSFSMLEHLSKAEVNHRKNTVIEPKMVQVGDERRPAILAMAPSEIRFRAVRLGSGSVLRFGVGLSIVGQATEADGIRFAVRLDDELRSVELWSQTLNLENQSWVDVELDLAARAGQVVDLVLVTEPWASLDFAVSAWSHPVLKSNGTEVDLEDLAMLREVASKPLDAAASVQTLEIPDRARLELVGEVRAIPGHKIRGIASATFRVRVDGEQVFARSLRLVGKASSFFQEIPLETFAGQTVELSLETDRSLRHLRARSEGPVGEPEGFQAEWLRGRVVDLEPTPRQPRGSGPNLLLLVVDTLRADHLSLYGYDRETSPNLDRLASESLVFNRAISQSSWTLPAVASLLTGLNPLEHGVDEGQHLESQFRTLPEILQENGMTTFALSANPVVGQQEGFHQGFETFLHLPEASAGDVRQVFETFIEENQDLRWFGYLHYIDPHDPYRAPGAAGKAFTEGLRSRFSSQGEFKRLWRGVNFGRGRSKYENSDVEYLRAAYDQEILYWDSEFGALIEKMRTSGLLENTVVIVTSDHGEEFLEHGKLKHGLQLYDESIWVPLVVWAPDRLVAERREHEVETLGVIHAALELMNVGQPGEESPESWLASSRRKEPAFSYTNHAVLAGQSGRKKMVSVQDSEWKYIAYLEADAVGELYHLHADPAEQVDQAAENPQVLERYAAALEHWKETSKPLTGAKADPSHGTLEKLRALGYLE